MGGTLLESAWTPPSVPSAGTEQGVPKGAPDAQHPAAPFPLLSAGQQEHGRLRAGHLSDIQQKSLSFLQSLKVCPVPFCQVCPVPSARQMTAVSPLGLFYLG